MKIIISIIIFFLLSIDSISQIGFSPVIDTTITKTTLQSLSLVNRELSGDTLTVIGGLPYTITSRHKDNAGNDKAAQFILERFQSYGIQAAYMQFSSSGQNVIGTRAGSKYPNRYYIICSHYDDMPSTGLAPGADDNCSGTCAVLEAARLLALFTFDYTVKFIAFDEEEQGLVGSHNYVDSAIARGDSIMGVINMDMIAYDGDNDFNASLFCVDRNEAFADYVKNAINLYTPLMVPYVIIQNITGSDHYWFQESGYRALLGIEMMSDFNPYYHTSNDKNSNLNMPYYLNYTRGLIAALMTYAWDYFIDIIHTPITEGNGYTPVIATSVIRSPLIISKVMNGPRLYYKLDSNGTFNYVNAHYNNLDTFKFMIPDQPPGHTVFYYIAAQDENSKIVGTLPFGGKGIMPPGTIPPPTLFSYSVIVGVSKNNVPSKYSLEQNFPNPFNPFTMIKFSLAKMSMAKLVIYDAVGQEISQPVNNFLQAGDHAARFDAGDLASGIYYYSLFIDGALFETKKMILIK